MNLFQSTIQRDDDGGMHISFGPQNFKLEPDFVQQLPRLRDYPAGPITIGVRPEGFNLASDADAEHSVEVDVNVVEMLRTGAHIRLAINTNKLYFFDADGNNLRHDDGA